MCTHVGFRNNNNNDNIVFNNIYSLSSNYDWVKINYKANELTDHSITQKCLVNITVTTNNL